VQGGVTPILGCSVHFEVIEDRLQVIGSGGNKVDDLIFRQLG
jgi:hypothetical protein